MKRRVFLALLVLISLAFWIWRQEQKPALKLAPSPSPSTLRSEVGTRPALDARVQGPLSTTQAKASASAPAHRAKGRICVSDAKGRAAAELPLVLYCSDTSAPLPASAGMTDEDGCFETYLCQNPEAVTCVRIPDARHRRREAWVLDSASSTFEYQLASPAIVSGQIQDASGVPVKGAKIWFEAQAREPWTAPPFAQMQAQSDAQGAFRFVAARPAPCDPCVRDEQDCELSRRVDEADAPVPGTLWIRHAGHGLKAVPMPLAWGAMEAVVLDGRRAWIRGQLTGVEPDRVKLMLSARGHRRDRQVGQLDAQGSFEFTGLGEGDYRLTVFVDGSPVLREDALRQGQVLSLDL